jgi:hypothetical protein
MKNIQFVKMTEGDGSVGQLQDHVNGGTSLDGTRKHGVKWFEWMEGEEMKMMSKSNAYAAAVSQK